MNFFEHQDQARARSTRLVVYYILAVIGMVASVYCVAAIATIATSQDSNGQSTVGFWQPGTAVLVVLGVLVVVGGGSLYKISQMAAGGAVVAKSLGGRLLEPSTRDLDKRKLLNIVEEMALASGVPVPPVYVIEESAINAFAAGYKPEDAVIGVTRGAMQLLNRDELQGVIAHEFSHIFNGDMRLNIRLVGVVFGILMLAQVGEIMLRTAWYGQLFGGGHRRSSNDKDNKGNAMLVILAVGIALMVIGFLGVIFGNLIKAAVSRQREFLADASAVQFTRNPDGIGNALKKLGGLSVGGHLRHPHASEFSHMYFAEGVSNFLGNALATHPPLPQRIKAIDPRWDGQFIHTEMPATGKRRFGGGRGRGQAGLAGAAGFAADSGDANLASNLANQAHPYGEPNTRQAAESAAERLRAARMRLQQGQGFADQPDALSAIGQVNPEHVAYAETLLAGLPEAIRDAARTPAGAMAVLCGLLLDPKDAQVQRHQIKTVASQMGADVLHALQRLLPSFRKVAIEARLPLVDLCMASVRQLSEPRKQALVATVEDLVRADGQVDLFEWVMGWILHKRVTAQHQPGARQRSTRLSQETRHVGIVLSALAYAGGRTLDAVEAAFAKGQAALPISVQRVNPDQASMEALDESLSDLAGLVPKDKQRLVQAMAQVVAADGQITLMEGELMRAMAEALDVPMPPILPGQKLVG